MAKYELTKEALADLEDIWKRTYPFDEPNPQKCSEMQKMEGAQKCLIPRDI